MGIFSSMKRTIKEARKRMFLRFLKKALKEDLNLSDIYIQKIKDNQELSAKNLKDLSSLSAEQFRDLAQHLSEKHKEIIEEFKREGEDFTKKRKRILDKLEDALDKAYQMEDKARYLLQLSANITLQLKSTAVERKTLLGEIHRRVDLLFSDIKALDKIDENIQDLTKELRQSQLSSSDINKYKSTEIETTNQTQ